MIAHARFAAPPVATTAPLGRPLGSTGRRIALVLAAWLLFAPLAACPDAPAPDGLLLEVTADSNTGGPLDALEVRLQKGDQRFPTPSGASQGLISLTSSQDPAKAPVYIGISYPGERFGDGLGVTATVVGYVEGQLRASWESKLDLGTPGLIKVRLTSRAIECDADRDGFADCSVAGCCDAGSVFGDCDGQDAATNPWAVEDACEPCADTVDQDCDGADVACQDSDNDGVADCAEELCGKGDPNVGPGLVERCDGVDNNCDGLVDETFTVAGSAIGETCGVGACAGGVVQCAPNFDGARCSSDVAASEEDCDGIDNDCDGQVDEGCAVGDIDGDGFTTEDGDCDDYDAGKFPNAPESCCPAFAQGNPDAEAACDRNCDVSDVIFCDPADVDGDGFLSPQDCDDTDPNVFPGAPEACGDGVDQDCFGGDLSCAGVNDGDSDGYAAADDCDDADADVYPGAPELCDTKDNDCDGLFDEGNPGGGAICGTQQGTCSEGTLVCDNSAALGVLSCLGGKQPVDEVCDGLDNDCDGETDEDFSYDGVPIGGACVGVGACGAGQVMCSLLQAGATCSSNPDGNASQATPEVCDAFDNDCDGELNENVTDLAASNCLKQGVCAADDAVVSATCNPDTTGTWSCDYSGVPGYFDGAEPLCDGLDNDCDGSIDEDFDAGLGCEGDDEDLCKNGVITCDEAQTGTYCDESNAANSVEVCDGEDNDCDGEIDEDFVLLGTPCDGLDNDQCANGIYVCALDGSGEACPEESITDIAEVCDGQDNNCDGAIDETFALLGQPCDGADADGCQNGTYTCHPDGQQVSCVNESVENIVEVCDGEDNDCDGAVDEDFGDLGDPCDGNDSDECANGTRTCNAAGSGTECSNETVTYTESCDGLDNDCDGSIDEDFGPGGSVTLTATLFDEDLGKVKGDSCGTGSCAGGTVVCTQDGTSIGCSSGHLADEEVCNGADDDCDGDLDETFKDGSVTFDGGPDPSDAGGVLGDACGSGACSNGSVVCGSEDTLTCSSLSNAATEICDLVDNDCDGSLNENLNNAADSDCLSAGVCAVGGVVAQCNSGGTWDCDYGGVADYVASESGSAFCDALDNDCDGATDENHPTVGDACDGPDTDACLNGTFGCNAGGTGVVCGTESPANIVEVCDTVDNDCDGQIDEGDVCVACVETAPFEVCGDCVDNDCDGEVDETPCSYEFLVHVEGQGSAVPLGHSVNVQVDHAAMVNNGRSTASGNDVSLFYALGNGSFVPLHRVVDPESGWNQPDTVVWFGTNASLGATGSDPNYRLYTRPSPLSGQVLDDERQVFHFADFFDRANSQDLNAGAAGAAWVQTALVGDVDIASNQLFFEAVSDTPQDPIVTHGFADITGGFEWRFRMDWTRTSEGEYRVHMQLGDGLEAAPTPMSGTNVGPHLVWGGPSGSPSMSGHNGFGHADGGALTQWMTLAGSHPITVRGSTSSQNYTLSTGASLSAARPFDTNVTALSQVRFYTWNLYSATGRRFDYVIVRPTLSNEPNVKLDEFTGGCPLDDGGLVARYRIDEAASGATGTLFDSGPGTPVHLTLNASGGQPSFFEFDGQRGIRFNNAGQDGTASASAENNKLSALHATRTLTVEWVMAISDVSTPPAPRLIHIGPSSANTFSKLSVQALDGGALRLQFMQTSDSAVVSGPRWDGAWTGERAVYHLVWDTAQAAAGDRVRLYRNGVLIPVATPNTAPNLSGGLFVDASWSSASLFLGNSGGGNFSPDADIFYAAIYGVAMEGAQISTNATALLNDDDTP